MADFETTTKVTHSNIEKLVWHCHLLKASTLDVLATAAHNLQAWGISKMFKYRRL